MPNDQLENFMLEMDAQQPNWYIDLATQQQLIQFAGVLKRSKIPDIQRELDLLRVNTGRNLFVCARASYLMEKQNGN